MGFMTSVEAGEKWSLSKRRVAVLCAEGRIPGAEKKANVWLIPDTLKNLWMLVLKAESTLKM